MKVFRDYANSPVRLTDERLAHILEHPEMAGLVDSIETTLRSPKAVVGSVSDEEAMLYYRACSGGEIANKYLCVVVKKRPDDAFVLTAYLTDRIKTGISIWNAST